jgi:alpha-glucosidase
MNIKKALLALRSLGLKKVTPVVQYTMQRDRLDRLVLKNLGLSDPGLPGAFLSIDEIPSGARFQFEHALLEVRYLTPDLARLSWEPGLSPLPYALARQEWPDTAVDLSEGETGYALASLELHLLIERNGAVTFSQPSGAVLRRDLAPILKTGLSSPTTAWTLQTRLLEEERIYGLGERAAPLNRRGRSYQMWNTDPGGSYGPGKDPLYISIPSYLSLHSSGSYLIFYENSFKSIFSVDVPSPNSGERLGLLEAAFEDGMLRYYFIPGTPEKALERFTELTGRAPLPPRWALGYHQCRWGYKSESEVRQIVAGFKINDMPLNAVHLDIDYMHEYRVFTVDRERFPDLSALSRDFAEQNIKVVTILDPGVKVDPDYSVYDQGLEKEVFVTRPEGDPLIGQVWPGASVYPDFTNPAAREWWSGLYPFLLDQGIAGIWHDMNEPTSFTSWGDMTLPLDSQHDLEGRRGDHRQAHNLYALLMNRAGYEALERFRPERRPWIITRSGWAGMQRYAWNWTGDTETSWGALKMTIPTVLGLGLCGVPFNGPDIGGFSGDPSPELYLRWFQLAAFLPYFRTHCSIGTQPREPWIYGEPYTSILRDFLKLRCRLTPYIYTLAWQASQTGHPLIRPLFWSHAEEPALWDVDDAFLLGDFILAAPIVEAGALQREVLLPSGGWFDFWDDQLYQGGAFVTLEAPFERMPLLVRQGSILPMEEAGRLLLHIYPDYQGQAQGFLYSDDGDGYGPYRLDRLAFRSSAQGYEIRRQEEGQYLFPYSRVTLIIHGPQGLVQKDIRLPQNDEWVEV